MKKSIIAFTFILILILSLFGCASKAGDGSAAASTAPRTEAAYWEADTALSLAQSGGLLAAEEAEDALDQGEPGVGYGGHKIIRSFSLNLETDSFDAHLAAILGRMEALGGYVQSSYIYGRKPEVYGEAGRYAQLTIRVPAEQADAFVSDASAYGTLISKNENARDVTESYFDLETRLSVYRAQLERLQSILVETDNLADILALESEIARVTIEIESLTTELRRYDGLIDYATVELYLEEEPLKSGPAAALSMGERISGGFQESLKAVANFFENSFVWLASNLPAILAWALALGLLALLLRGLCRRQRRARDRKKGETKE